jgi:mannosyl-oligosaccharide alpha-1,2-mannosidase
LADRLSFAFATPSGVPFNNLDFSTNSSADPVDPTNGLTNGLATIGTLVLEWTHLSDLTGNPKYSNLVSKAESHLLNPQPSSGQPFPGLLGSDVAVSTGLFTDSDGGWSGGTDSFYEYLLKMYIYDSSNTKYRDRWLTAVESTMKNLIQNPTPNAKSDFVAEYNARSLSLNEGHLTCFIGGNFLLGGQLLQRNDIFNAGLKLTSGCHDTYASTASGIGPERWSWNTSRIPNAQSAFEKKNGWYITVPSYDLRPEVVESLYHAYKLTGQRQYADWAWNAFEAINASCRTGSGYSSISDVTQENGGSQTDLQESFWFAEVLKYLYLTFALDVTVGVNSGGSGWVFNTEAHPFKTKG